MATENEYAYNIWLLGGSCLNGTVTATQLREFESAWKDTTPRLIYLLDTEGQLYLTREYWIAFAVDYESVSIKEAGFRQEAN